MSAKPAEYKYKGVHVQMNTDTPSYNLKAVVRETGIKAETLRAWERRYGIPRPARSAGGHRIYSRRDIDTLHWLNRRRQEGLSIGRAAERWQSMENEGRDPLQERGAAPADHFFVGQRWTEGPRIDDGGLDDADVQINSACADWVAACVAFDEAGAQQILTNAFALFPVEIVCQHVFCNGLRQLGEEWHRDKVSVQQVSFAAGQAMQRVKVLLGACPPPTRPGQILLACPPGESHTFGIALLQLILKRKGFGTVYLGDNLPANATEETLSKIRPDLVILVSQQLRSAGNLLELAERAIHNRVPVASGGRVLNLSEPIRRRIPGDFLGTNLLQAGSRVESLLTSSYQNRDAALLPNEYRDLLDSYRSNLLQISSLVLKPAQGDPPQWAALGRPYFSISNSLVAALRLGDPSLISLESQWLSTFLDSRSIPIQVMEEYLTLAAAAVESVLGADADPINQMLETLLTEIQTYIHASEPQGA